MSIYDAIIEQGKWKGARKAAEGNPIASIISGGMAGVEKGMETKAKKAEEVNKSSRELYAKMLEKQMEGMQLFAQDASGATKPASMLDFQKAAKGLAEGMYQIGPDSRGNVPVIDKNGNFQGLVWMPKKTNETVDTSVQVFDEETGEWSEGPKYQGKKGEAPKTVTRSRPGSGGGGKTESERRFTELNALADNIKMSMKNAADQNEYDLQAQRLKGIENEMAGLINQPQLKQKTTTVPGKPNIFQKAQNVARKLPLPGASLIPEAKPAPVITNESYLETPGQQPQQSQADPQITARIQQLRQSKMPDAQIAAFLREKQIDPAIYGLQ